MIQSAGSLVNGNRYPAQVSYQRSFRFSARSWTWQTARRPWFHRYLWLTGEEKLQGIGTERAKQIPGLPTFFLQNCEPRLISETETIRAELSQVYADLIDTQTEFIRIEHPSKSYPRIIYCIAHAQGANGAIGGALCGSHEGRLENESAANSLQAC